jgi:hypothetical protein
MNVQRRRRRNWVVFWLVLIGIPVLAFVAYGLALARAFSVL